MTKSDLLHAGEQGINPSEQVIQPSSLRWQIGNFQNIIFTKVIWPGEADLSPELRLSYCQVRVFFILQLNVKGQRENEIIKWGGHGRKGRTVGNEHVQHGPGFRAGSSLGLYIFAAFEFYPINSPPCRGAKGQDQIK